MTTYLDDKELVTKSVTAGDIGRVENGGIIRVLVPLSSWYQGKMALPPELPAYWSYQRDFVLSSTVHNEAMWGAAIGIAITQTASLSWEVQSAVSLKARRAHEMLLMADTPRVGWVGFLAKHLRDYLTTDNGAFVEIVRATKSAGSRIVGIRHLDSKRCTRTGDPQIPVLYRDRNGRQHELKSHQVFMLADMPDPADTYYGVGLCAASRAYKAIYKLGVIENFVTEKVSGQRPLAIYIASGMLTNQIEGAIMAAKEQQIGKGLASFMGAVIVGVPGDKPPQVATIPLAELPDGFSRKEEFDLAILTYANAIGLDPQDLQPLSGQSLGTGAQSQVLDDKSRGRGLAAWRQQFTHMLNSFVFPTGVKFTFLENDYRDQEKRAAISKTRAETAKTRIESGVTLPEQELQVLVDLDELPKSFLEKDTTPGDKLSDADQTGPDMEAEKPEPEAIQDTEQAPTEAENQALEMAGIKELAINLAEIMGKAAEKYDQYRDKDPEKGPETGD